VKILTVVVAGLVGLFLVAKRLRPFTRAMWKSERDEKEAMERIDRALKATGDPNEPARWVP
jgi:hypothetical protein